MKKINLLIILITFTLIFTGCGAPIIVKNPLVNEEPASENSSEVIIQTQNKESTESTTVNNNEEQKDALDIVKVHFIDVGQGDSILIQMKNEGVLIDTGNPGYDEKILSYMDSVGVDTLNYFILTHPHNDHIGSASKIIDEIDIKNVYMPDRVHTTKAFENIIDSLENKGLTYESPKPHDVFYMGEVKFEVLAPFDVNTEELNNVSIVVKMTYGKNNFLFMGDAEAEVEREIISEFGKEYVDVDVLKAGHHMSETSSSKEFVEAVTPFYVIGMIGEDNKYGHPDAVIVDRYSDLNVNILRTDLSGDIIISTDGNSLSVNTEKNGGIVDSIIPVVIPETTEAIVNNESNNTEPSKYKLKLYFLNATLIENNHIGSNWSTSATVNGIEIPTDGLPLEESMLLKVEAQENDKNPDLGSIEKTIPTEAGKFSIIVDVVENGGRYSGNSAKWEFEFEIKE